MKASILAAAVAVATLGFAGTASAQGYGYNYRTYNPYTSSFINGRVQYTPFGVQNYSVFNNPYYGYGGQALNYQDPFGNTSGQVVKYNPFTGLGYTTGYYNPGLYGNPYLGYRYGYYFR